MNQFHRCNMHFIFVEKSEKCRKTRQNQVNQLLCEWLTRREYSDNIYMLVLIRTYFFADVALACLFPSFTMFSFKMLI